MNPDEPLSEKDLKLILRRINNGASNDPSVQAFLQNDEGWKLTKDQQMKGKKWLLKKKSKLGAREMDALENMKEIRVAGTAPGEYNNYQYPLYWVKGRDNSFLYKVEGGELYLLG